MAAVLFLLGALAGYIASRAFKSGAPPTPQMAIDEAKRIKETVQSSHPEQTDLACRPARPEEIRASIEANRMELAHSLERLRGEVAEITDWRKQIAQHQKQVLIGAAVAGFVIGGGIAAVGGLFRRRTVVPTLSEPVRHALDAGGAVVALESTIIAHGLPRPRNLAVARELEAAVRAAGAVPATIAVLDGEPCIGLDEDELERIADGRHRQAQRPRPALAAARGADGATTVAATAHLAARAGIRVFATGGLGGVHRGARESWDESADLLALARTADHRRRRRREVDPRRRRDARAPGDARRRRRRLAHDRFPGFYLTDGGFDVDWSVDRPDEVAAAMAAADALGVESALVVANPVDPAEQLDPDEHERVLAEGLERARAAGITGKAVTPFLLDHLHRATDGRSLEVNIAVARGNAAVAGAIAAAWAARS